MKLSLILRDYTATMLGRTGEVLVILQLAFVDIKRRQIEWGDLLYVRKMKIHPLGASSCVSFQHRLQRRPSIITESEK